MENQRPVWYPLQRGGTCRGEKEWHGDTMDVRLKRAKEYLTMPDLTIEETGQALRDTDL